MAAGDSALGELALGALRDTPLWVLLFGPGGAVSWVNQTVEEGLGVTLEELRGHPAATVLAGELPELEGTSRRVEGDFALYRSDGSKVWVKGRLSRIRDRVGRRIGTALVASATSSGAHWHHRILRGALPATMGMMGAEVAHQVNNPSTWLRLNLDQLRTDLLGGTQIEESLMRELLDECLEGLDRISQIASELRALARPGHDELESTDLRQVVAAACSLAPLSAEGQVIVRRELSPVPRLQLAPGRVGLAIWAVLSLCARLSEGAGSAPSLSVSLGHAGDHVLLDVEVVEALPLEAGVLEPGARSQGPPALRMARTVVAAHGGLILALPGAHGLRLQLPVVRHVPLS